MSQIFEPKIKLGTSMYGINKTAELKQEVAPGVTTSTRLVEDPTVEFYIAFGNHKFLVGMVEV